MKIWQYFFTIIRSLSPDSYKQLVTDSVVQAFKYFSFIFIICYVVMGLFFIPTLFGFSGYLDNKFAEFEELKVDISLKTNAPVMLSKQPIVVVDSEKTLQEDEKVLITKDSVFYKTFFKKGIVSFADFKDVLSNKEQIKSYISILFWLILPSLAVLFLVYSFVKYMVFVYLLAGIGFFMTRLIRYKIRYSNLLKISFYSITSMLIIDLAFFKYHVPFFIPLILNLIVFAIAVFIVGDKIFTKSKKRIEPKNKSEEIFGMGEK